MLFKIVRQLSFKENYNLCKLSSKLRKVIYAEKCLEQFDLSKFCLFAEDDVEVVEDLCPTIKHLTLKGDILNLQLFQRFEDIVAPFRFLRSLTLSKCPVVNTLEFVWFLPFTLRALHLDRLYLVPPDDFVKFVLMLKNILDGLSIAHMVQLTKYDLVNILKGFWKLDYLDLRHTEYLTLGTSGIIATYCYNLDTFYFTLDFKVKDCRAWTGLLGMDLEHITFTPEVYELLTTYYKIECQLDERGYASWDEDSEEWPNF